MKRAPFIALCLLVLSSSLSAEVPWWKTFEQGKRQYRAREYGAALLSFEDSIRLRKAYWLSRRKIMIDTLSLHSIRVLGGQLDKIERELLQTQLLDSGTDLSVLAEKVPRKSLRETSRLELLDLRNVKAKTIQEEDFIVRSVLGELEAGELDALMAEAEARPGYSRDDRNALGVLEELYTLRDRSSFSNSSQNVLDYLSGLQNYPEAEYWLGKVYCAEGELNLALSQWEKAGAQSPWLENPGDERTILYEMVAIYAQRHDYQKMSEKLETILEKDELYKSFVKREKSNPLVDYLEKHGVDSFLTLYRYPAPAFLEAHQRLGLFYSVSGRNGPAKDHLTFAFLIASTVMIEDLHHADPDWTFTSLKSLIREAQADEDLSLYLSKSGYFKTMYYLASALYFSPRENRTTALELWGFLRSTPAAGEWRNRAVQQLASPSQEIELDLSETGAAARR